MMPDDVALGLALGRYAVNQLKAQRIVVVDDRTAYGQGTADQFEQGVKSAGGVVVAREFTNDKATEFSRVVNSLRSANADLVFVGGMDATAGPLFAQMRRANVSAKMMGGDGICSGDLPRLASGESMDMQVFCAEAGGIPNTMAGPMSDFKQRFKQRFGRDIVVYAPYTYDAVGVIVDAMVRAGSTLPAAVLSALKSTNYSGLTGQYRFDQKGDPVFGFATMHSYQGGRMINTALLEIRN